MGMWMKAYDCLAGKTILLGNYVLFYTILYLSAILSPNKFDDDIARDRYVPKRLRWTRLRKVKRLSYDFMVCFVNTLDSWVTKKDLSRDFRKPRRKRRYNWFPRRLAARDRYRIHIEAATSKKHPNVHENQEPFCTDACPVGIDNRASACISHKIGDFVGPLTKVNRSIKGFHCETVMNVYRGTLIWKWHDNEGQLHRLRIPNSYYIPHGNCRLLSPQHWAKTQIGNGKSQLHRNGCGSTTTYNNIRLFWGRNKYALDVPLGKNDNVATFYLASGFKSFNLFCQECKIDYDQVEKEPVHVFPAGVVSDDEDDNDDDDVSTSPMMQPATTFWRLLRSFSIALDFADSNWA